MATTVVRTCRRTIAKSSESTGRTLWSRAGAPDLELTSHHPASLPRSLSCRGRLVCFSPHCSHTTHAADHIPPAPEPADTHEEPRTSVNSNWQLGGLCNVRLPDPAAVQTPVSAFCIGQFDGERTRSCRRPGRSAVVHPAPDPDELGGSIARGRRGLILPRRRTQKSPGDERRRGRAMHALVGPRVNGPQR